MARNTLKNFVNKKHASYSGWVLGELCDAGLDAFPVLMDGEFSAFIRILASAGEFTIIVPPPPPDWDLPRL